MQALKEQSEFIDPVGRPARVTLWVSALVAALFLVVSLFVDGVVRDLGLGFIPMLPFLGIAVFVHLSDKVEGLLTLAWMGAVGVLGLLYLTGIGYFSADLFSSEPQSDLWGLGVLLVATAMIAPLAHPKCRQFFGDCLGVDVQTNAQHIGVFLATGMTLLLLVPLFATGRPPVLGEGGGEPSDASSDLALTLFSLYAQIPVAFVLVGFGISRGGRSSIKRLGLEWRGPKSILVGLAAAFVLIVAVALVAPLATFVLEQLGLPAMSEQQTEELFGLSTLTILGAAAMSLGAGLGEEILIRGALQPRLGIVLSNLLFAAAHGLQYTFDSMIVVLLIGFGFAFLRRRFGTITSIIAHVTYDLILFSIALM